MNYIKEINAFYIEIETNSLSTGAGMLWHTLLHVNNRARWVDEFSVAEAVLCYKAGLSSSGFKRARTELKEKGYISFLSRGTKAPMYKMISLVKTVENPITEHVVKADISLVEENKRLHVDEIVNEVANEVVGPLYKQNETKQKETKKKTTSIRSAAHLFYSENFGEPPSYIEVEILLWIDIVGEELAIEAMKRALENGKVSWKYVKAILVRWKEAHLTTLTDVLIAEEIYRTNRAASAHTGFGRQDEYSTEVIPDWFREMKAQERVEARERVM